MAQVASRLKELAEELRVVQDQLSHLSEEADDLSLRAMVSETPAATFEYRDARRHADAMLSRRDSIVAEMAELEKKMNDYLDKMQESRQ